MSNFDSEPQQNLTAHSFILLICTLRSTVAFFSLFFTLDLAFLMLGIGYLQNDGAHPQGDCIIAGGAFGLMAAFLAWYNALAGIADSSNRLVSFHLASQKRHANTVQFLRHSRRPLPLVRQGSRAPRQGRQL